MHRLRSKARILADFFGKLKSTFQASTLNALEGVTATAEELNKTAGLTATTAELNKMTGVTASTAEINVMAGVTVSTDELNKTSFLKEAQTTTMSSDESDTMLSTKLSTATQESITKLGVVANPIFSGSTIMQGGVVETQGSSTVSGTTVTADLGTGNFFEFDLEGLSGNVATFTISNINATSNRISCFITKIIQGSTTTTRNFSWATIVSNGTNIDWAGGAGPDITTGNDKVDILSFTTYDNGTTWFGAPVGQEFY